MPVDAHSHPRTINIEWIGAEGLRAPPLTKPATLVELGISVAWEFSDATDDTIVANFRIPDEMDRLIAPTIALGWSSPVVDPGDDSKQATWQVEYLWTAPGEDVSAAAQGTLIVTESASTLAGGNGLVLSMVTLVAPSAEDICVHLRIKRLGAADSLGDVAHLTGICLSFVRDKFGSPYLEP